MLFDMLKITMTTDAVFDEYFTNGIAVDHYVATANDAEKNEYRIYWDIFEGFDNWDDESLACDWDHPSLIWMCDEYGHEKTQISGSVQITNIDGRVITVDVSV